MAGTPRQPGVLYEQALTAVYRILFLCFAEARGLVPTWHPVYQGRLHDGIAAHRGRDARARHTGSGRPFRPSRASRTMGATPAICV